MSLYKYTQPERIDIIENQFIRFTQPQYFNDPFECQIALTNVAEPNYISDFITKNIDRIIFDIHKEKSNQPGSFSLYSALDFWHTNQPELTKYMASEISNKTPILQTYFNKLLETNIGILSLSRSYNDLLMWAHYAKDHSGLLIEFDESNTFFNRTSDTGVPLFKIQDVEYSDTRPNATLADLDINTPLLTKSIHWAYEKEVRIIMGLHNADKTIDNNIYLFKIPASCLKSVTLGCKASQKLRDNTLEIIHSNENLRHITLHESAIDPLKYKINISNLKP
jgi:hypothetical protein